jgi:hypothetical protein
MRDEQKKDAIDRLGLGNLPTDSYPHIDARLDDSKQPEVTPKKQNDAPSILPAWLVFWLVLSAIPALLILVPAAVNYAKYGPPMLGVDEFDLILPFLIMLAYTAFEMVLRARAS